MAKYYQDDPTVMGFNLLFYFDSKESPLFYEGNDGDSAIRYLRSVGEIRRSELLQDFKYKLRAVALEYPYYFQKLSGMESLYKFEAGTSYWMNERILKIETLESIDHRIATIIQRYMDATFDHEYMREMLPSNLKKFSFNLYITEIRQFQTFVSKTIGSESWYVDDKGNSSSEYLQRILGTYNYKFSDCEFDFGDSNPFMKELSNGESNEFATNEFSINCGVLREEHNLNFVELFSKLQSGGEENGDRVSVRSIRKDGPLEKPQKNRQFFGIDGGKINQLLKETDVKNKTIRLAESVGITNTLEEEMSRLKKEADRGLARLGEILKDKIGLNELIELQKRIQLSNNVLSEEIYNNPKFDKLGKIDEKKLIEIVTLMLGNIENFGDQPLSSLISTIIAGSLGSITNLGRNVLK